MQAIKFVVRRSAGDFERGLVLNQVDTGQISLNLAGTAGSVVPQDISLHLARHQITNYGRDGSSLWITLADGRSLEIENFFSAQGTAHSRLFVSSDGQISEVVFDNGAGKELLAQYQGQEAWGKWNPSDSLLFYDEPEPMGLANAPGGYEDETVSMLGTGLALGPAMLTGAAAPAALVAGGASVLSALTSGGGTSPGAANVSVSIATGIVETNGIISGGELADGSFTVTGQTDPGASVLVTIGDTSLPAEVDGNGAWSVVFPSSAAPAGEYNLNVTAQATDAQGNTADANGTIAVDTVVNHLTVTENVTGGDNVANSAELQSGLPLSGQVEPGSQVSVVFNGKTYNASVTADGAWSMTIPQQDLPDGAYTAHFNVLATDAAGNTATLTDSIEIDQSSPDAPQIETHEYGFSDKTTKKVSFSQTSDNLSVDQVSSDGSAQSLHITSSNDTANSRTYIDFQTPVPDGSTLVVTAQDDAGNSNGTLMILDVGIGSSHDLSGFDLDAYEITVIDLQSAEATEVTLTEEQVLGLSSLSDTVKVYGHDNDSLVLTGAVKGEEVIDGNGDKFVLYTMGDEARILADEDLAVSI
ncbi:hypothetical protein GN278_13935 [Rhodobacteraceae bacterium Araon29]